VKIQLFSILIITTFLACNQKNGTVNIKSVNPDAIAQDYGKAPENYKQYCAGCHGEKMEAFVDRQWKHGKNTEDIYKSIKTGITAAGMPSYEATFSEQELNDLVKFIQRGLENQKLFEGAEKLKSNIVTTNDYTIRLDTMVYGIEVPWGMDFDKAGNMYFTQRKGTLSVRKTNGIVEEINGLPILKSFGQGGLMDVELHPDFENNKRIYIGYTKPKSIDGQEFYTTAVSYATLSGNQLTDTKEIFEALPYFNTRHHFGCRLEFDKNGLLFIAVGDRGKEKENPQDLSRYPGKIHRVKDDGSIPDDNPFVNQANAVKSIYSYGHRNPQGIAIHPETGALWDSEHGPRGGDEVNICIAGKNYGWPVISYGINYNGTTFTDKTAMEGMEQPEKYWIPSIAPSGTIFVKGDIYPKWKGDLLVGSLRFNYLNRSIIKNNKIIGEEMLLKGVGRMRDVQIDKNGYLYVSVENPGAIYKLVPVGK
jgi:glucose/arabinose dehydrogenase